MKSTRSTKTVVHRSRLRFASSVAALARWRWRQHWFLLLVIGMGMVAAVVMVCAVPLLSTVMQTAGLRSELNSTYTSSEISLRADVAGLATQGVEHVYQSIHPSFDQHLGTYLNGSPRLDIATPGLSIISPPPPGSTDKMVLYATSMSEAASHLRLAQGRLPQAVPAANNAINNGIEVAITPEMGASIHLAIGSNITLELFFYPQPAVENTISAHPLPSILQRIHLHVVGLFNVKEDDYWHDDTFLPDNQDLGGGASRTIFTVLASDQGLLKALDQVAKSNGTDQVYFSQPSNVFWFYHLAPERISIDQLNDVIGRLNATQLDMVNNFSDPHMVLVPPHISTITLYGAMLSTSQTPGSLDRFRSHLAVLRIPVTLLALQILCLILFFVSVMAELLVDRQVGAIALLRSRGASGRQVFGSLVTQSIGLGLIALVIGPFLALGAVFFVAQRLLAPIDQGALNVLTNAPVPALFNVRWYAVIAAAVCVVAMGFSLFRASRMDVLALGREGGRSTRRPFWRRFNLDVVAAVIALTGYGVSVYLTNIGGLLDAQTQAIVSTPLTLIAPIFLVIAAVLLFLRFFPQLLRMASRIAMRRQGAAPLLAMAQMARAPRQSMRMTVLLALAIAFAFYTLVFTATQAQRSVDIAAYKAGADFSGDIPNATYVLPVKDETRLYGKIAGVLSATIGYTGEGNSDLLASATPLQFSAVDPDTFAQTAAWSKDDSSQPLTSLLALLIAQREQGLRDNVIPAVVDASAWSRLSLHIGATFPMQLSNTSGVTVRYMAVAEVQHIPAVDNGTDGGVMVDYQTFAAIVKMDHNATLLANHIWLRTQDTPQALASSRNALNNSALRLANLYDRRAFIDTLNSEPLSLNITSVLLIAASTVLLLALLGNLLASWLSVRTRLLSFVVLRALGADRRQVASVLLWEQGVIYGTALLLGSLFGWLLAATLVPTLTFTSIPASSIIGAISNSEFYALQNIIPVHIVFPLSLLLALIVLALLCVVALGMMVRVVLQPSPSQTLRLDEEWSSDASTREGESITRSRARPAASSRSRRSFVPPIVTLALWRMRDTWFLLLVEGVGMIAAITLVCAVPLFSDVATAAGLSNVLSATPTSSEITADTVTQGLSTQVVQGIQRQLDPLFQQYLGTYLSRSTAFSLQTEGFDLISPKPAQSGYEMRLTATSLALAAPHLTLVQGRLAQTSVTNGEIETMLAPTVAKALHVTVGSLLTLHYQTFLKQQSPGRTAPGGILKLRIVGLFNVNAAQAVFWHGQDFQIAQQNQLPLYTVLVSSDAFLATLDQLATTSQADAIFSPQEFELTWQYHLNVSRVGINQLGDLIAKLTLLQKSFADKFGNLQVQIQSESVLQSPYLTQATLFNPTAGSYDLPLTLDQYRNSIALFQIPVTILSLQIVALILFFVSLIANLLVDHQADAIAILRSRGSSSSQIFGSLVVQSIGLAVIALVVSLPLAVIVVSFISQHFLLAAEQQAINLVTGRPIQAIVEVAWYAAATALVAVFVMCILLRRAAQMDVLAIRREAARTTKSPLWQRLNLDVVAAVIALTGYAISFYLTNVGTLLDIRTQALVAAPLALVAPIFLLTGSVLLFLRCFPYLLQVGARLAARNHGAVSMLALAQISRAPRQTVRMTLLLALPTAFAIFTLVFTASQSQRALDIAAYEAGADFSGNLPVVSADLSLKNETARYSAIAGVLSTTPGYSGQGFSSGTSLVIPIQVRAVDSSTFARTASWNAQDSSQSLSSLMEQLAAQRQEGIHHDVVPVIIDADTMNKLSLHIGSIFTVSQSTLATADVNCQVIAVVQHIPSVNGSPAAGNIGDFAPPGGVLGDYTTFAAVYKLNSLAGGVNGNPYLPINHIWLRTNDDQDSLAHVRAALATPGLRLDTLYDRRLLGQTLQTDPLYLDLLIILTLGAATALLLALLGDLLASWINVRTRLTNFAVLRALGTTPWQVASVLLWEQGIVYITAILIGSAFGALLAATVVPALVFTSIPAGGVLSSISSNEFYVIQHVIPVQLVIPLALGIIFIGLVVLCAVVLGMMVRVVLRPSMSQTIRLNED